MEWELKYKIKSRKEIIDRLRAAGARDLGCRKEVDIFFGSGAKSFRVRKLGREGLLTHKRFVACRANAKVREEIQTNVSDVDKLLEILKIMGFSEIKRREKIRRAFKLDASQVMLDRLPFMGFFLEIESPSEKELNKTSEKLGLLAAEGCSDSYDNLFFCYLAVNAEKFKKYPVPILPTFQSEKDFKNS